jgi:APA family basic amino acid/polyamine antiporter
MTQLERSLNLWEVTLMGVGVILGAGIYVVIGEAAGLSGNALWLSFIFASVVASFTGLSYAELSSRFPHAGAEYVYVKQSFGDVLAWLVSWFIIVGSSIGVATVSLGFSNYFSALFTTPILPTAIVMLLLCTIILIAGVKETAFFTIIFMIIEAVGLIIIIAIGLPFIGSVDYLALSEGIRGVIQAGVLIFFGYIGFEGIARLAEETEDAAKNMPKAIILSIAITTVIYLLVGIAAVSIVGWEQLSQAQAPLAFVAEQVLGGESFLILTIIVLFSTFNTALATLLSGSRVIYGIAKEKVIPSFFSKVLRRTKTPWVAIGSVVGLSMVFLLIGDIQVVANLTNFTIFAIFISVNASVIYLRYRDPIDHGFHVPGSIGKLPILPVLGIISSGFMIVNISLPVLGLGIGVMALGFLAYYILKRQAEGSLF